ncbi:HD domain-containing protein [Clostridium botulinum]|uniref:bis(5'-nucleosyl)-tetraphosphatase (symmetrical) n=1 Tax=Clostridium botulinum TaxID=1491 RepID=A0A6B4PLX1_CLOBO|nr:MULTISPECIES: bis(5'-nucleosyl)-tetraphosphatase (symmetrical) YqeK [Clostridium]KIL08827.1 phosphohydrolase [Clostridium botulinum]MBN1057450.1 HD domain-containing protein [Clostridium botulinum]MBN1060696.1 HD domain-containing protein [Clostridium botulinum]MBN1073225.1 HD domain-containing protein [Clostridium botulinum]MBN1076562.1 HD domain-containing protein [Clostridium botulinum]
MLSIEEIKLYLKENLKSNRYNHTLGVVETAKKLAEVNKISIEKAEIAALAHDVAKNLSLQKMQSIIEKNNIELTNTEKENSNLWHSIIAPIEARNKLKIDDEDILDAVRWHTTGKENMSILTKIIYIADMIEPGRDFPGVEKIRQTTFENLDEGVLLGLTESMKDLLNRNLIIDLNTIKARNYFLLKETMC